MLPKARAMLDLVAACKKLGWEARMHSAGGVEDGLVAGTAGYVRDVTGAFGAHESVGKHGVVSGETDPAQDAPEAPTEPVEDRPKGAENHGKTPKDKVVGRILSVGGQPVGLLARGSTTDEG